MAGGYLIQEWDFPRTYCRGFKTTVVKTTTRWRIQGTGRFPGKDNQFPTPSFFYLVNITK
jgi:hypothetical protein